MEEIILENNEEVLPEEVPADEVQTEEVVAEEIKTEAQLLREAEEEEKARKAKIAAIFDKITTGILIFLMASPFLILLYIFIWFLG